MTSIVRLGEERIDRDTFERLQTRLHAHVDVIQRSLANKAETRRQLAIIDLVSFLIPLLIGMRRRNKVPNIERLLPPLSGKARALSKARPSVTIAHLDS